jgi:hypothetical protein
LKKKFDDIFAATRYTKALAAIKDQRKTLSSELKELEGKKREAEAKRHSVHAVCHRTVCFGVLYVQTESFITADARRAQEF